MKRLVGRHERVTLVRLLMRQEKGQRQMETLAAKLRARVAEAVAHSPDLMGKLDGTGATASWAPRCGSWSRARISCAPHATQRSPPTTTSGMV